ncbi:MAG TPA: TIGR02678 family protein, partial [Ktedonobacteraceae bacterium]|nr:TIGR02678 family protein [Ktedonobacteraceae bacterium]
GTKDTIEEIPATPAIAQQKMYSADLLKAHVALMEKEVILPRQVDLFRLVNRHYRALQTWHDLNTGWRVQRGPTAIRLIRHLSATTPGYLYERLKEPGDFACLTWILWFAENRQLTGRGNDQQFLLSQLAESISEQSTSTVTGEAQFDFRRQNDRYSIQRALQTLENLGGLQLVDGQTREWVEQTPDADVLYEFTDVIHALVAALNPQLVAMVATRLHDTAITLQPTRLVGMAETPSDLMRAWRVLLLGPALFRFDDPPAFVALVAHADGVANELIETFGWLLDIHRDYACIVRASGMSTGPVTSLTPYGTNDQIAMLLCKAIRGQVEAGTWAAPDAYGCLHVTVEDMAELFYSVRERYGEQWGSEARGKSSRGLLNDVYRKMRQIGLLRGPDEAGNMLVLPTAARYTATYDKAEQAIAPGKGQANKAKSANTSINAPVKIELPGISTPVKSTIKKR